MATLASAVNSSEPLWTTDVAIADSTIYIKAESEVLEVIADFPGSTYPPTGGTTPPRVRVKRAIGGTTAASHAQGVTLTEYSDASVFAGPGGAAEPGTLAEVLAQGNDTGGLGIVNLPAVDVDAHVERTATVSGTGNAIADTATEAEDGTASVRTIAAAFGTGAVDARTTLTTVDGDIDGNTEMTATGDGSVYGSIVAGALGSGSADVDAIANAITNDAKARRLANAAGGNADTSALAVTSGAGLALADSYATSEDGDAYVRGVAETTGDGNATVEAYAQTAAGSPGIAEATLMARRGGVAASVKVFSDSLGSRLEITANGVGTDGTAIVSDDGDAVWGGVLTGAAAPIAAPTASLPLYLDTSASNALYVWDGAAWQGPYVVTP